MKTHEATTQTADTTVADTTVTDTTVTYTTVDSPIGPLLLIAEDGALTGLYMDSSRHPVTLDSQWREDAAAAPLPAAAEQLAAYFRGELRTFDLPLDPAGTDFQRRVWRLLEEISYGTTASYRQLAERADSPRAVRAVGQANGRNPISIVVPCHRVIGADGSLTGYGGGLARKEALLEFEAAVEARGPHPFPAELPLFAEAVG